MKIIYRYITFKFLKIFLIVFVISLSLFYVIDFFNNLSTLLSNKVNASYVLIYYLSYTPKMVYILLPFVFAISALITLGYMAFTNEILAMKNSSVSTLNIGLPFLILSAIFVLFMIILDNFIVPYTYNKALLVREIYIENKNQNLWAKSDNIFVNINSLFYARQLANIVSVYFVNENNINKVALSQQAKIDKNALILQNPYMIKLKKDNISKTQLKQLSIEKINLLSFVKNLEYNSPNIWQLYQLLKKFQKNNFFYTAQIVFKIAYPLSIISLLPMLLFIAGNISARKDDFVKKVFSGSLLSLIFLGILMLFNSLAQTKIINPVFPILSILVVWFLVFLIKVVEK